MARLLVHRAWIACFALSGIGLVMSSAGGCRGRAHDDLYRQKLTGEIRNLEDQLYEADYENRVLADKLQWAQQQLEQMEDPAGSRAYSRGSQRRESSGDRRPAEVPAPPAPDRSDYRGSQPSADAGSRPGSDRGSALDIDLEEIEIDAGTLLQPSPGGPEPPGESDLHVSPIEPGEVLPPPGPGGEPEAPPGQIELNETMNFLGRVKASAAETPPPTAVRVHPTLSGPYRFDSTDDAEGFLLVLHGVDDKGRLVPLDDFEIDAELTVVALDPAREPSEARLGRWELSVDEVREHLRAKPVSGIHLPLPWQGTLPLGDEVIVHVRFRTPMGEGASEGDGLESAGELVCEGRLNLGDAASTARWTPRGAETRR